MRALRDNVVNAKFARKAAFAGTARGRRNPPQSLPLSRNRRRRRRPRIASSVVGCREAASHLNP
jgi:hypothetical protein